LQPQLDVWGQPIERTASWITPLRISAPKGGIVEDELTRLKFSVGRPGDSIDGIKLTPDEYVEYQRLAGQYTYKYMQQLIQNPQYRRASDAEKTVVMRGARAVARKQVAQKIKARISKSRYPKETPKTIGSASELITVRP
jgi:hypothetical protein